MLEISKLLDLSDKSAIVTGAAKGIGFAIASRLAQAGANVLLADVDEDGVKESAQKLEDEGFKALGEKVDVSSEIDIQNMVASCVEHFGSIDILVNNAGIFPSIPISKMSLEEFERIIAVNLKSVFLTTKHACALMRHQNSGGKIINITSIDAVHPSMVGLAAYDSSKHGVWGFTKNAALEYAPDKIWINAIAPGGIYTPGVAAMQSQSNLDPQIDQESAVEAFLSKIPMHRMGEPDDIGKVALFLASDMSNYMTGEQIVVDGGALLS